LELAVEEKYRITNENINTGKNEYARFDARNKLVVTKPKTGKEPISFVSDLFPRNRLVSLYEILSTVNKITNFTSCFEHWQIKNNRQKPHERVFFAGAIAYGCNLGVCKISKISSSINHNTIISNSDTRLFSSKNDFGNALCIATIIFVSFPFCIQAYK